MLEIVLPRFPISPTLAYPLQMLSLGVVELVQGEIETNQE